MGQGACGFHTLLRVTGFRCHLTPGSWQNQLNSPAPRTQELGCGRGFPGLRGEAWMFWPGQTWLLTDSIFGVTQLMNIGAEHWCHVLPHPMDAFMCCGWTAEGWVGAWVGGRRLGG